MTKNFSIREAHAEDIDALWMFLAVAGYEPDAEAAKAVPIVASHLIGWPRPGDFGAIAECEGRAVGAAWARQFTPDEAPIYLAGPNTPEISIGVLKWVRCLGIGKSLLEHLAKLARQRRLDGLCLNVRDSNPARRLYERAGYRLVDGAAVRNRVGGMSLGMLLELGEDCIAIPSIDNERKPA